MSILWKTAIISFFSLKKIINRGEKLEVGEGMINKQKLPGLIEFINISKLDGDDIYTWVRAGKPAASCKLDMLAVKALVKTADIFYQITRRDRKICFIRQNKILYMIAAGEEVQFQVLEAILEQIINSFLEFYGDIIDQYAGDFSDTFTGFDEFINDTFLNIGDYIKYVKAQCRACKSIINVCVKKSMIENATDYPVSLVYIHEGHGLLIYIDAGYRVRAAEIVNTSA